MGKINVLSFEVANLIAAGEVVDRPSSVIKELVENSIDAGADRVTIEIQRGGVLFMRVTDNGCGMEPEDLPVAVRRHATSKIRDAGDLEEIMTLGFRGEALAAISAVSDVRIITKTADAALGSYIEVNSGRIGEVSERGASTGTTVIVENLFANVPARLKFLKRDQTEAMSVCGVVEKIALSHPEIAFRLISDGTVKLDSPGSGDLFAAIRSVYGREFAQKLIRLECELSGVRAEGYITSPDAPRANRNYQNFFINGRYIKTRTGSAALEQAYTSYIPPEKFPGCILSLQISPRVVDVNVHPSKLEVKFSNERPVFDCVYQGVRTALLQNTLRPGAAPVAEEKESAGVFVPPRKPYSAPVSGAFVPVRDRTGETKGEERQLDITDGLPNGHPGGFPNGSSGSASVGISGGIPGKSGPAAFSRPVSVFPEGPVSVPPLNTLRAPVPLNYGPALTQRDPAPAEKHPPEAPAAHPAVREETPEEQPEVRPDARPDAASVGVYRIVGELFNSYIVVERKDELLLIDKHAAHERLIFEKLKKASREAERSVQLLAVPITVGLMAEEVQALEEYREQIVSAGFSFVTERNTVSVNGIPADVSPDAVPAMIESFADVIRNSTGSVELTRDIVFEKALYQASCKAAVKAGRVYPEGYNEWLVKQLYENPEVTYCPHGRPVAFTVTKAEIDRKFKRT